MQRRTLNLGISPHVDASTTTLTERLLYAAGVIDEFGGNAIVAAQLIARLSDEYGIRVTLRTIVDSGSIAGVARDAEQALRKEISAMSPDEIAQALGKIRAHRRGEG